MIGSEIAQIYYPRCNACSKQEIGWKIAADSFSNGHNTAGNRSIGTMSTPLESCVRALKHDRLENCGNILPTMQCMFKTGNWLKNCRKIAADSFSNGHNTVGNGSIGTMSTPLESCVRALYIYSWNRLSGQLRWRFPFCFSTRYIWTSHTVQAVDHLSINICP